MGEQKWSGGHEESLVPPPTLCLYLIYKYRDVYMMALALSVSADAPMLTVALGTDAPAQPLPSCVALPNPGDLWSPASLG